MEEHTLSKVSRIGVGEQRDGDEYKGWLRYASLASDHVSRYAGLCRKLYLIDSTSDEILTSAKDELLAGIQSMLGSAPSVSAEADGQAIWIGTCDQPQIAELIEDDQAARTGEDGYIVRT